MKALRIFLPLAALLAHAVSAQTNDPGANSPTAQRARELMRGATNGPSRRFLGSPATPGTLTNAAGAPVTMSNALPTIATNAPLNTAVAAEATVTLPNVPAGQVPTRTTPPAQTFQFPSFPTPPMTRSEAAAAAAAAAAAGTNRPPANAAAPGAVGDDEEAGVVDFANATLDQVFEAYQGYSGRTVLRPATLPGTITIHSAKPLTKKEAVEALDSVLALNGVVMLNLGENFVKAVPAAQADKEGAAIDKSKASDLPETEQFVTKIVTLKTVKPTEIATVIAGFTKTQSAITPIDSNMTLVLRDYSSNIRRMMELIEKIDVLPEKDFKLEVIPIRYGKVSDIYATMSSLISGGGGGGATGGTGFNATGTGGRNSGFGGANMNRGGRMGGMGNQYGGQYGGGMGSQYGGMNRNYGGGSIYPQQVAQPSAAGAQSSFNNRLNSIINKATKPEEQQILEGANIVPDERSNKLLIFANKRDMEMITNIVAKVDVLLAQVLIEAVILEVSYDDSLSYGVTAAQNPKQFTPHFQGAGASIPKNGPALFSSLTNFPGGAPEGFSYFGKFGSSFDVAIQAVSNGRKANVVSRPRIQTSHAIPGNIFVGQTRPYVTGFANYSGIGAGLQTQSQVQERTIGLTLAVTPFITPDGLVVMELQQQFDSYKGDITVNQNPYPLVDSRMADSTLTVRNGDLIMMGGFITESHSNEKNGVPFLKDIPGLGALFRSTVKSSNRGELIILMKATVLETPEQAAFMAAEERATLPGVREAEMEQNESDRKRAKELKKKEQKNQR